MEALWAPGTVVGWVFVIGVASIVPLYLLIRRMEKRHRQEVERVAQEMGFLVDVEGESLRGAPFLSLPFLKRSRWPTNVLRGTVGSWEALVVDVEARVSMHREGRAGQTDTVVLLRLAGKQFPLFELHAKSFRTEIAFNLRGYTNIGFETNQAFSQSYLLRGEDEAAVRTLFHHGLLTFFEQQRDWSVEGAGEWLAVYKWAAPVALWNKRAFAEQAGEVATAFLSEPNSNGTATTVLKP